MAANSKPLLFIIGGAFHTPASYQKLTTALDSAGYEVHIPLLTTGNQQRPPNGDLKSDTALVRCCVESLVRAGRYVVVIAHSYGGQVCSNALVGLGVAARSPQGLSGGVSSLIYMSSYALPEGTAALDKTAEFGNMDLVPVVFDVAADKTGVLRDPRGGMVDPGIDDAEAEAYLKTLVRWNLQCLYQPTEFAAWKEIPVAYIYTTADMLLPLHYQQSMVEGVEKSGVKVQTFELNTGHCPFLADAHGIVHIVNTVALG